MREVEKRKGNQNVIIGMKNKGKDVKEDIWQRIKEKGKIIEDKEWNIKKIYEGMIEGENFVREKLKRY